MPLKSYGVVSGRVAGTRREGGKDTPHYQIELVDDAGAHYRIAVNVLSQQAPSELLYCVVDDFRHPITGSVPAPGSGWTVLPSGVGLDFIRGNLFDPASMRPLPPDVSGPDNDLADLLEHYVSRTQHMYVFGERWGPETVADKIFGFKPGNGVHDVHMNQGNSGQFQRDDGVWQDGGLLFRFADRWAALFLAFQSQSWHTDDTTGHPIDVGPSPTQASVRIVGALVNPIGPAPEVEKVTLINASAVAVDLSGWQLVDRTKATCPLPRNVLDAGATLQVTLANGVQLGNRGGTLTVLDGRGLKVHGVSYTEEQARQEGWTVVF